MSDNKRDYTKEQLRDKELNKRYTVKVPIHIAKSLDEKLKKENETYSKMALNAIIEYLKKNK